ncbi:hypothetical protein DIX60_03655 [Streptococcus iniae]|uniref:cation transporter n=1 Tax=Streptococcus iniae TaxID=1346 RepID=UPI0008DAA268|nr:cation transporter [Streptococcus iniae]OHX27169.1 hypothetical protein BKX95_06525 [Streptococcus iniae]RLV28074.1 hypothetical protein DIX60_03655 [Streptococcus iniae]
MTQRKTIFELKGMDCPSEEQLVRIVLGNFEKVQTIKVNLAKKQVAVTHQEDSQKLLEALDDLKLQTQLVEDFTVEEAEATDTKQMLQKFILGQVLIINIAFFILEELAGYYLHSLGLAADGLDMLADSFVYGLALFAVGKSLLFKKKVSALAGYFQLILALLGFLQVIYRCLNHDYLPNPLGMFVIALMALLANLISYYMVLKVDQTEVHIKASKLFTSNDIVINIGVMLSSLLVYFFQSPIPDLIIGSLIFALVLKGALKIIALSK